MSAESKSSKRRVHELFRIQKFSERVVQAKRHRTNAGASVLMGTVRYNDQDTHKDQALELDQVDHGWLTVLLGLRRLAFTEEYFLQEQENIPYGQQLVDAESVPTLKDLFTKDLGPALATTVASWVVMLQCAYVADLTYDQEKDEEEWLNDVKQELAAEFQAVRAKASYHGGVCHARRWPVAESITVEDINSWRSIQQNYVNTSCTLPSGANGTYALGQIGQAGLFPDADIQCPLLAAVRRIKQMHSSAAKSKPEKPTSAYVHSLFALAIVKHRARIEILESPQVPQVPQAPNSRGWAKSALLNIIAEQQEYMERQAELIRKTMRIDELMRGMVYAVMEPVYKSQSHSDIISGAVVVTNPRPESPDELFKDWTRTWDWVKEELRDDEAEDTPGHHEWFKKLLMEMDTYQTRE